MGHESIRLVAHIVVANSLEDESTCPNLVYLQFKMFFISFINIILLLSFWGMNLETYIPDILFLILCAMLGIILIGNCIAIYTLHSHYIVNAQEQWRKYGNVIGDIVQELYLFIRIKMI